MKTSLRRVDDVFSATISHVPIRLEDVSEKFSQGGFIRTNVFALVTHLEDVWEDKKMLP